MADRYGSARRHDRTIGRDGCTTISDTNANTGGWYALVVLTDTVFTTLTIEDDDGDGITGITIPAGMVIRGAITAITLSSGTVQAFKDPSVLQDYP